MDSYPAQLPESLAPEPAGTLGVMVGYTRTLPGGQPLGDSVRMLQDTGCTRVFTDRPPWPEGSTGLSECLEQSAAGDVLVVLSMDHLAASVAEVVSAVAAVHRKGLGFRSLREELDTTVPGGRLVFEVFVSLAGLRGKAISQGTRTGLATARARGVRLGRPPAMDPDQIVLAQGLLDRPGETVASIARRLELSRTTLYKYVPDLGGADLDDQSAARSGEPTVARTAYQSRPGRPVLVAIHLAELRGPTTGPVEMPLRLFWSARNRIFDLDDPDQVRSVYETVLGQASAAEDLAFLNGRRLAEIWPVLFLPKPVRRAWEDHHPALSPVRKAA